MSKRFGLAYILTVAFCLLLSSKIYAVPVCGNGVIEGYEECDDAQANSDSAPDGCRTNCVKARCGDYGVDSGEECDDFPNNSNVIPNACRWDCKRAHCGDGVLDNGEVCDDKNSDAYDGCHQCQACYPLKDDLVLSGNPGDNIRICPGRYELQDNGQEGILIIAGSGVNVDLSGVTLVGVTQSLMAAGKVQSSASVAKQIASQPVPKTSSRGARGKTVQVPAAETPPQDQGSPVSPVHIQASTIKQGVGIVVKGNDAVLHDVDITNFKQGIKLKSSGAVLFNNKACGNSVDILSEQTGNFGVKNSCGSQQGWQENGQPGCIRGCN